MIAMQRPFEADAADAAGRGPASPARRFLLTLLPALLGCPSGCSLVNGACVIG
jgi:hypothetical protein